MNNMISKDVYDTLQCNISYNDFISGLPADIIIDDIHIEILYHNNVILIESKNYATLKAEREAVKNNIKLNLPEPFMVLTDEELIIIIDNIKEKQIFTRSLFYDDYDNYMRLLNKEIEVQSRNFVQK